MKIRCNEIVTPAGVIDGLVIVEDGKIAQIVPAAELKEEAWDEDWRGYKLLPGLILSLIHISEPTRQAEISYAVFCLKKKTHKKSSA